MRLSGSAEGVWGRGVFGGGWADVFVAKACERGRCGEVEGMSNERGGGTEKAGRRLNPNKFLVDTRGGWL